MTADISWLEKRLHGDGDVVVIDGGMGSELQKNGVPMDPRVWSSTAMLSHPETVRQVHEDFINAGAEVIITNTFSSARHMLEPAGLGDGVEELNIQAVRLAQQARDNTTRNPVAIAGSICEWLSTDDTGWHSVEAVARSAGEQARIFADTGSDLIAIEMCQRVDLSCAVIEAVLEAGLPLWIGVTAKSRDSDAPLAVFDFEDRDFEELVIRVVQYPAMVINVMHTPLPDVLPALEVVRRHWDGPVGVYPESGYFTMPNWQFVDIVEPEVLGKEARSWIDGGVRMVGGCCGIGPEHIGALCQAVKPK
jgi:S-methylmethionine-dependent homocysteine/selenocysteine methylase